MPARPMPAKLPGLRSGPRAGLGPHDWIMAGFHALAQAGPVAVRVEPLARALGATKGSFYWHFKDLRALHQAMLEAWEALAAEAITDVPGAAGLSGAARVMALAEAVSVLPPEEAGGAAIEPAIRDWARVDPMARAVVMRVDRRRLRDLALLFMEAGLPGCEAGQAAERFYAGLIGLEGLRITCGIPLAPVMREVARGILAGALQPLPEQAEVQAQPVLVLDASQRRIGQGNAAPDRIFRQGQGGEVEAGDRRREGISVSGPGPRAASPFSGAGFGGRASRG